MKFSCRLPARGPESHEDKDVTRTARFIGKAIDKATIRLFASFNETLLKKPVTYIVPAVWGGATEGKLDPIQEEIHSQIAPVLDRIFKCIGRRNMNSSQQFVFEFQVRDLIVSKIVFMVEALKNRRMMEQPTANDRVYRLEDLEPLGTA